jgi:adenine-specific DNA-methyltransferase
MGSAKEQAYTKIKALIERFSEHVEEYKRYGYNEHQTRVDYINPFFKALGWDMDNEQGYAEAYREVIHEDKVKVGSSTKAPDYGFTLFGQRKFFVDAKKPAVNIKDDISPAYQVRRYGWSAKVAVSIVSDFEEFSIYDCTKKPLPTDKASVARIKYITYDQYLDEFDFLWDIFAKENLPKGRFDKYVQSDTRRKGTATVDDEFLKSIEQWRIYLATTIAVRNKSLNEDEINYAVQKIIDRIIFLRMCEDRGVEQYGELKKSSEKGDIYQNLFALCRRADDKYNSGLFDFKEDKITTSLTIDNKVLKNLIEELYYPKCEYEFSVMPADILGSVYERFLGKTIRLTKAHYAKIEEKPEVRKAGGVYYTPKYIVDYIVKNTVGKLIENKTPKQVEKIKICDPACGSGSFLIGAYQFLLDWHLKYYINNPPKKKKDNPLTPASMLTTAEKKRILLNNIFGVDIDTQAVEVTKLNLLLKALEGETQASISQQLALFHERVLPNLGSNIKNGNSIISSDFYDNMLDLFPERMKKINAFDWGEGFPEIFNQGGFDVVIGNPPYVRVQNLEYQVIDYYKTSYKSCHQRTDLYLMFIEKGLSLLRKKGKLSYICPILFTNSDYGKGLRQFLLKHQIEQIVDFSNLPVFKDAITYTAIFTISNDRPADINYIKMGTLDAIENQLSNLVFSKVPVKYLSESDWIFADKTELDLIGKVENQDALGELAIINSGCFTGLDQVFFVNDATIKENKLERGLIYPVIMGKEPKKYYLHKPIRKAIYPYEEVDGKTELIPEDKLKKSFPQTYAFLKQHKKELRSRKDSRRTFDEAGKPWYSYTRKGLINVFQSPKILVGYIVNDNTYCLDFNQYIFSVGRVFAIASDDLSLLKFLLGILNSSVSRYLMKQKCPVKQGGYFKISSKYLNEFPIPKRNGNDLVKLVDNLLNLNKQLQDAKLHTQQQQIQRTIAYAEKKIDKLVYKLYELNDKEIETIENSQSRVVS